MLDQIVRERGAASELVWTDNAPGTTANTLCDWCRLGAAASVNEQPERRTADSHKGWTDKRAVRYAVRARQAPAAGAHEAEDRMTTLRGRTRRKRPDHLCR